MDATRFALLILAVIFGGAAIGQDEGANSTLRGSAPEDYLKGQISPEQLAAEETYWKRIPLPTNDLVLEPTGIVAVPPKRLLVTTRRGDIWWVDGAYEADPKPRYTVFASGLHEPLGIVAAPQGGYYVVHREELLHIADRDGDGRADDFTVVWKIPVSGDYHEFAFGPELGPNGRLRINLNLAASPPGPRGGMSSPVPWRGWMLEVTPDGKMTPIAAGMRAPVGITVTTKGDWFYSENQGDWVGAGRITHVERGDFLGNVGGLVWSGEPNSPVKLRPQDIPDTGEPMFDVAQRVPGLKPPAVWFPQYTMGQSTTDILEDTTRGRFGPFAGQFFIGEQWQRKVMRMSLEKVKGVWQGASYPFRAGFDAGVIRLAWGEDGSLFSGETGRGWGAGLSKDPKNPFGLERLVWTGKTPFEIQEVRAQPDGFLLTFTQPLDRKIAAEPASYKVTGFTYKYHSNYGSPVINAQESPVRKVVVASDGLSVRLATSCLRQGYIHEVKASGLRAADDGKPLLHDAAYYTLNQFPDGKRLLPTQGRGDGCNADETQRAAASSQGASSVSKHQTQPPASWPKAEGDVTLQLTAQPGLKFDQELLIVKAGARVRFTLRNSDDMLHNFVLATPGQDQAVAQMALKMGVEGSAKHFVPDTPKVLTHTSILEPGARETIYFTAPAAPGDYTFVCTFPGHQSMRGILRVE